jgi:hypothetical protein
MRETSTSLDDLELVLGVPDGSLDDLVGTLHRLNDERNTASRDLNLTAHAVDGESYRVRRLALLHAFLKAESEGEGATY